MASALLPESQSPSVPTSKEEEDLLARRLKKVKNVTQPADPSREQWPKPGQANSIFTKGGTSFVNKLKGIEQDETTAAGSKAFADSIDGNLSDDDMSDDSEPLCRIVEDNDRNFPHFFFSEKMKRRMYKDWNSSVIVTLLGRSIGFKALETRVQSLWAKKGVVKLIDIGHGYHVVKFTNTEDYHNALTGGPWLIYDHYLVVRPWEPMFNPATAKVDRVAVWIRFPRIFLEYYNKEALTFIGNRIGETVKVDFNTSSHSRGHYARLCVLVDLTKQLMAGFAIEGHQYYIEYEGLHMLCSNCGFYGHRRDSCPMGGKQSTRVNGNGTGNGQPNDCNMDGNNMSDGEKRTSEDTWIVVQKPRRPRKNIDKQGQSSDRIPTGSRFAMLAEEVGGDKTDMRATESSPFVFREQGMAEEHRTLVRRTMKVRKEAKRKSDVVAVAVNEVLGAGKGGEEGCQELMRNKRVDSRVRDKLGSNTGDKGDSRGLITGGEGIEAVGGNEGLVGLDSEHSGVGPQDHSTNPYDPGEQGVMAAQLELNESGLEELAGVEGNVDLGGPDTVVPETPMSQ
ncbi:hypothetical protein QN277_014391 [Acacia crassicarpa]|uniref:DUF4283 domain-containing protein n=1 Tax=Acacia crassicarpa TaxID=499986 RepID=A0AAE1IM38_9FABA|nr:hypothetical protein QN277_014391 [Acacia crassicarpa]